LQRAWEQVRRNHGAPGIDQVTIAQVERDGVDRLLGKLGVALEGGRYRPLATRRVLLAKPGSSPQRPWSIPTVTDRVVPAALTIVREPIVEADMVDGSFGFRPRRAAQDGLPVVVDESWKGRRWVVESDIAACVSAIPPSEVRSAVKERIGDRKVLGVLGGFLGAGVLQDGSVRRPGTGTHRAGAVARVGQRLPAPAGPGGAWRGGDAGAVRRCSAGALPVPWAGPGRAGAAGVRLADLGLQPRRPRRRSWT
jgi:RNA-directed DNA polymerase